jgi:alcohol dehydrogenase class IV
MDFEFATATRIVFGNGRAGDLGDIAAGIGSRAFVVTGGSLERYAWALDALRARGLDPVACRIAAEPTVERIVEATGAARTGGCDLVVAVGGGSALDAGKAVAALIANPGEPADYLEVIGEGLPLARPSAPLVAVPTTAGTGSEVTRNAVLASGEHRVKVSMRSPWMLPRLALVDPELTRSMSPAVTAATGLDALTQCIEPYVSRRANPLTDAVSLEGVRRAARSLARACADGDDADAREDMAVASLCGGLALANAGLGGAHGFAGPVGGMFPAAPHGVICARLLPHVMDANVRALRGRAPDSPALQRYDRIARVLTGEPGAMAADGVAWVRDLCTDLSVPPLSAFGMGPEAHAEVVDKARRSSSMKGNPVELTPEELTAILSAAA